jgi:hypothetical protein
LSIAGELQSKQGVSTHVFVTYLDDEPGNRVRVEPASQVILRRETPIARSATTSRFGPIRLQVTV